MNKHIEEYLNFYLELEKATYAVLLNGKWGCGKTFFIDQYIEQKKEKFIKISLFGLKNITDIDEMIFYQLYPIFDNKLVKITGSVLKTAVKLGIKLDLDGNKQSETTVTPNLDKINLVDFFSKNKNLDDNIIFVFDDLERTNINFSIILGYINHLTEQSGFKMIVIANTEEIKDDNKDIFQSFSEKVIGTTLEVSHDFDNVLDEFLENDNELLSNHKTSIKDVNLSCENSNLRIIKQVIHDFKYLASIIEPKYLENDDFVEQLIRQFFFFSIYQKNNNTIEDYCKKIISENKMYQLFSNDIWQKILETRTISGSNLNSLISKLIYFREEITKENYEWLKLWEYITLEDKEFFDLVNTMIDKFKKYQYEDIQIFLHVVDLLIHFINEKMIKFTLNEVKSIINSTLSKEIFLPKSEVREWIEYSGLGRGYLARETPEFTEIQKQINTYNNDLLLKEESKRVTSYEPEILRDILSNDYKFTKEILSSKNLDTPMFHKFDVKKFIQHLNEANNKSLKNFYEIIGIRYYDQDQYRLKDELDFWQKFNSELEELIQSLNSNLPIKKHNLNLLSNESIDIIKKLQN